MRSLFVLAVLVALAVPAAGQLPKVSHIWPDAGTNDQSVVAHIYGSNFQSPAVSSVVLKRLGCTDINGTSIDIISDGYLECLFDLAGKSVGVYGLVVANVSGADTLPLSFNVYASVPPSNWRKAIVGWGSSSMRDLAIGDGNSDGELEVYGVNHDNKMYQFKWDGAWWGRTADSCDTYMNAVTVGDGDGDGLTEVYAAAASPDSAIDQFTWYLGDWVRRTVGFGRSYMSDVAVGDGNGDGELEVYGAEGFLGNIYQFKWDGLSWGRTKVDSIWLGVHGITVGDGDGDGELELYVSCHDSRVYRLKWGGVAWSKDTVGYSGDWGEFMYSVAVGDGNGDGEMEVYGANYDSTIYQIKWDGAVWAKTAIGFGQAAMYGVAVGDGDGDGQMEVYGATGGTEAGIYEFKWDGGGWISTHVGSGSNTMQRVAVGDGDGDGEVEVYGASGDGHIYQFKRVPTGMQEIPQRNHEIPGLASPQSYPNPSSGDARIMYTLAAMGRVTLRIYNEAGQLARTLIDGFREPGEHMILWDGRDDRGEKLPSGSYFYQVETGVMSSSRKLILVK